ncbi:hypothetical protein J6TS2_22340 [Heyndrickxia sporothermodurans]|nr:hypothetical protein J6TS2_22340 [Heyndrickxia sporothermodurans]
MRKWLVMLILLLGLVGCSKGEAVNEKPPPVSIKIGNKLYETKLGTYCWSSEDKGLCVDTAGPVEMVKDEKPIKVKPGEKITLLMDYQPKPNEIHLSQIKDAKETEVSVINNQFTAPIKTGVYFYSYGVWWLDEKDKNVSNGDAFYAFVVEVDN